MRPAWCARDTLVFNVCLEDQVASSLQLLLPAPRAARTPICAASDRLGWRVNCGRFAERCEQLARMLQARSISWLYNTALDGPPAGLHLAPSDAAPHGHDRRPSIANEGSRRRGRAVAVYRSPPPRVLARLGEARGTRLPRLKIQGAGFSTPLTCGSSSTEILPRRCTARISTELDGLVLTVNGQRIFPNAHTERCESCPGCHRLVSLRAGRCSSSFTSRFRRSPNHHCGRHRIQ